ncbi:RrF2 family transcriptional regulator [Anaerosacchariphilus polymeriproducens]|uniref:Rrf2 family transcriptional regulator n=1 Tax=Anaerosacchariphilus polymeriproducens TaxID=1812858 RepID=A0A371ARF4_9FIRM|nr:Rrf2 family transcriptional regulator [Anaerosacchariphilus polymeriproducens]RDU22040.1 Rrf2 family transcriptional regulator [Anaerosacchariphilus polymeriproducens]
MKISTKGRYALRIMLDLAMHDIGESVRVKEISERQGISDKYLEQIISILNKAGYVRSTRGPQGGYRLARKPEEYTVGMILRLTEGSLSPVACMEDDMNQCDRQDECATLILWKKIDDAIKQIVDTYTLADLLEWQNQRGNDYII